VQDSQDDNLFVAKPGASGLVVRDLLGVLLKGGDELDINVVSVPRDSETWKPTWKSHP
jgi:hypothetical protein